MPVGDVLWYLIPINKTNNNSSNNNNNTSNSDDDNDDKKTNMIPGLVVPAITRILNIKEQKQLSFSMNYLNEMTRYNANNIFRYVIYEGTDNKDSNFLPHIRSTNVMTITWCKDLTSTLKQVMTEVIRSLNIYAGKYESFTKFKKRFLANTNSNAFAAQLKICKADLDAFQIYAIIQKYPNLKTLYVKWLQVKDPTKQKLLLHNTVTINYKKVMKQVTFAKLDEDLKQVIKYLEKQQGDECHCISEQQSTKIWQVFKGF